MNNFPNIGLVGIGLMGSVIARRLIHSGITPLGWDVEIQRRTEFKQDGGNAAESLEDVFQKAEIVILSLPNSHVVSDVYKTVKPLLHNGQFLVDTSTGNPDETKKLGEQFKKQNVEYLDATISGSSAIVAEGKGVMLVGASPLAWDKINPLLHLLCPKVFHIGEPGTGAQMKLVTNLVLGLNRAALAEGLAYAKSCGIDLDITLKMLMESMAYSRIMESKGHKMLAGDYVPQAKLSQHLKDVNLMLDTAGNQELPLTSSHLRLLQLGAEAGWGELDNCVLFKVYEELLQKAKA